MGLKGDVMKKQFKTTIAYKLLYRTLSLAILLIALFSCGSKKNLKEVSYDESYEESSNIEAKAFVAGQSQNFTAVSEGNKNNAYTVERKLIKRANVEFQSEDIEESKALIYKLVKKHDSYISEESEASGYSRITYNLEIRIPKDNFDSFLNELSAGVEKFDHKNIFVEDVTEEFIDINARLKIKKETEAQYLQLLKQAKTVKEILEVQNQVQMLRSDIESIEGRLKYLTKQVNFSTLNIDIYQRLERPSSSNSVFKRMWLAIKQGMHNFIELILVVLEGWMIIVVIIIAVFVIRKLRRNRKQGKRKNKQAIAINIPVMEEKTEENNEQ